MATVNTQQSHMYTGLGNMDMLKSQILTMFALRNGSNSQDGIFMAIWAIILITCIDAFFRFIPILASRVENIAKEYMKNKMHRLPVITNVTGLGETKEEASILLVRNYKENEKSGKLDALEFELVDAVIEHICNLDNSQHLRYTNKFHMNNNDPIIVSKDIIAKMEFIDLDNQTNAVNSIAIKLSSTTMKISHMKEYLVRIHATYRMEKCNRLGTQRYFFNEFHIPPMPDIDGGYRFETAPKRITFNMTPFNTFKSISNIFGSHIQDVRDRIDLFINHPEWYEKRGIPHTLGILLHGNPGCGKTSLIKAIARDTNRHVINITLRNTTTQRQLLNLFFDENLSITNSANETSTIAIPLDQRIYVIEDIDCMTDVVLDRQYLESIAKSKNKNNNMNTPIFNLNKKDEKRDEKRDENKDLMNEYNPTSGKMSGTTLIDNNFHLDDISGNHFEYL